MNFIQVFSNSRPYGFWMAGLIFCGAVQPILSQTGPPPPQNIPPTFLWKSEHVKHLIGLSEIKGNIDGTLALSPTEFIFTMPNGQTTVQRTEIKAVSIGDERMETLGTFGRIGRKAIPYGGGSAVAMMTQKKVDILSLEYRDTNHAYHGIVFLLPKNEAIQLRDMFPPPPSPEVVEAPQPPCVSGTPQPKTLKVSMITVVGTPLPTEYKVLLYEHLMSRLQHDAGFEHVFRDGDRSPAAACPAVNLALTVNAFTKGNAVMRASTGPLGFFLGATSLKFHVLLQDDQGKPVFEKDLKATQRGDSESLDVADKIAKTVTKKLKKLPNP